MVWVCLIKPPIFIYRTVVCLAILGSGPHPYMKSSCLHLLACEEINRPPTLNVAERKEFVGRIAKVKEVVARSVLEEVITSCL